MSWTTDQPEPMATVDLNVGDAAEVTPPGGIPARIRLLDVTEHRDDVRGAIRRAEVTVEVNGERATLVAANYRLPARVGDVQIDAPVTGGYGPQSSHPNPWAIRKAARLRVWAPEAPWLAPGTFAYPVAQRWAACGTQMANEPTYVDGGERPNTERVYYHFGLDFGAAEGLVEVRAVTDALVLAVEHDVLAGTDQQAFSPAPGRACLLDHHGWRWLYGHLQSFRPEVRAGVVLRAGQPMGVVGKQGASGGWSHLHLGLHRPMPDGERGADDAYAFALQAYLAEYSPPVLAVASPHHLAWAGQPVLLDGSRSLSPAGRPLCCTWTLGDGAIAEGATVERSYDRAGVYREMLEARDDAGNAAVDFATVVVLDRDRPDELPPSIHAAYAPTVGIRPGEPVTFKVRRFTKAAGRETWDFGDGSEPVHVASDGNVDPHARDGYAQTEHAFARPGRYIVSATTRNPAGLDGVARLAVDVAS